MISMIASVGKNLELGKNNQLIWHFSDDMKFFKRVTMGHKVIMGKNTYESLPKALIGREMIVISTKSAFRNVKVESSINNIVDKYTKGDEEVFIIGGASIYEQFLPYASRLYLTEIDAECVNASVYFPKFNHSEWKKKIIDKKECKGIKFTMCLYEKKVI